MEEKYYLEDGFPPEKREAIYREWWERQEVKSKVLHRLTIIFATGSIVLVIVLLQKLL